MRSVPLLAGDYRGGRDARIQLNGTPCGTESSLYLYRGL